MASRVTWPTSDALNRRLEFMAEGLRPQSRALANFRKEVHDIVVDDHRDKMLRGVDRYGQPRAALAASTLANPRRGPGPSLVPRGANSRFITNFQAAWSSQGGQWTLVCSFVGIDSKATKKRGPQPFAQYHLTGATKPGTRWVLPKRDVGGITPKGFAAINKAQAEFAQRLIKGGVIR